MSCAEHTAVATIAFLQLSCRGLSQNTPHSLLTQPFVMFRFPYSKGVQPSKYLITLCIFCPAVAIYFMLFFFFFWLNCSVWSWSQHCAARSPLTLCSLKSLLPKVGGAFDPSRENYLFCLFIELKIVLWDKCPWMFAC